MKPHGISNGIRWCEVKIMFDNKTFFNYIAEHNEDGAIKYMQDNNPDYLYKFYSLSDKVTDELDRKKLDTLRSNSNWFDLSEHQNDPLDMRMAYASNELHNDASSKQVELAEAFFTTLQKSMVLCSFSALDQFNLPMWSNYANNHKGYCIKYKITKKCAIWRIIYEENRIPTLAIPLDLLYAMEKSNDRGYETPELEQNCCLALLLLDIKHSSWQHEEEYRLLMPAIGDGGSNFRNDELGIIPTDVYIGKNCILEYEKEIKTICQKILKCNCYKAVTSKNKILDFI